MSSLICSTQDCVQPGNQEKAFQLSQFCWFKFPVAELAPKLVNFLCRCAASRYPLCFEVCFCLLILFSPPSALLKLLQHTLHNTKPSPFRDFWMNLNLLYHELFNLRQYFLFFDGTGSELTTIFFVMFQFFSWHQFYMVTIEKFDLSENKIQWCLGAREFMRLLKV